MLAFRCALSRKCLSRMSASPLPVPQFASVTRQGDILTVRCPPLLGSVYTPTFFPRSKGLLCCVLRVWYGSCSNHKRAAPEKRREGKFFMCSRGDESEETRAEKTLSPMCR